MKAIFFLVCLLNVLFFFWELHLGALTPRVEPRSHVPTLLLVSERETARRGAQVSAYLDKAAAELQGRQAADILLRLNPPKTVSMLTTSQHKSRPTASDRQQARVGQCYEAGPFNDQDALRRWANAQQLTAFQPLHKSIIAATDFQVYYPAAKDAEQTRINKLMLKAKGFADVWPITEGDIKGAISLGVFNDRQRAALYKTQLASQGVKAEIRQRNKTREEWFIRFTTTRAGTVKNATRLAQADCGNAPKSTAP